MDKEMNRIEELRKGIVEIGRRLYMRGYVAANDGNVSARVDDKNILITPTGISKGFMKPEDIVLVDMEGNILEGDRRPSSELLMHLKVYQEREDVNSVCHAHPVYATGFSVVGISLSQPVLTEVIMTLGSIPLVEYATPGTEEVYKSLVKYLKDYDGFLLANHGALTIGKDIFEAYYKMETLEHFAHIYFVAKQLGKINELNKKDVMKLKTGGGVD